MRGRDGLSSTRWRLAAGLSSAVAYSVAFIAIHARYGYEPMALTAVPLVAGGLLFGARGGLVAWVAMVPLNMVLHLVVGLSPGIFVGEGPVRALVALGVGLLVGRLRDLRLALEAEGARRRGEVLQRETAELRLRATLSAIPDLVLRISRDGTVLDFHPAVPDDGLRPASAPGGNVRDILPAEFAQHVMPALERTLDTGQPETAEYQLELGRGAQSFETRLAGIGANEALAIVRNVTEQKRLEELVRRREREQAETRMNEQLVITDRHVALGTLAAGAAHELNNPLAYVMANLDFVRAEIAKLPRDDRGPRAETGHLSEMETALKEAAEGAERMRVIVSDLKTFSRARDETTEYVDVRAQLDSAINMSRHHILDRANLVRDYGDVAPVVANRARIGQIFLNLLINAAHAIPVGARADNEVRIVTQMDSPGFVVVEVYDTGCGIAPAARDRLFDPFFTTKEVGVGTGLGLYVCRNLVTELGGAISGESRTTRGSVFRVRLPAAEPRASPDGA